MKLLRLVLVVLMIVGLAPLTWGSPNSSDPIDNNGLLDQLLDGVHQILDAVVELITSATDPPTASSTSSEPETDGPPTPEGYPWAEPVG